MDFGMLNPSFLTDALNVGYDMYNQQSIFSEKTMQMTSDLYDTKRKGLMNVMELLKQKSMMQHVCLLSFNILLDMLEQALMLEQGSVFDSAYEVLRGQIIDSIQRTRFD